MIVLMRGILTLFLMGLLLVGCKATGPIQIEKKDILIDKPGVYNIVPAKVILSVNIDSGGILRFALEDLKGNLIFKSDINPSAYSRWFLFWSESREVWLYSGDIGIYAWLPQKDGSYTRTSVVGDPASQSEIPSQFKERLGKR